MQHSKDCASNSQFREAERHRRPLETDFAAPVIARSVLCKLRAVELDRLIAGLSLTAGGVLGYLIAQWVQA